MEPEVNENFTPYLNKMNPTGCLKPLCYRLAYDNIVWHKPLYSILGNRKKQRIPKQEEVD